MKITIHSHPRSGTNFLLNNLTTLLANQNIKIEKSFLNELDNPDNFKVVVIREPVSTIISSYAHAEHFNENHDGVFRFGVINYQIGEYIKFLETIEKHLNDLNAYSFDDLDFALIDIASKFVSIPENFVAKFPNNTDNHLATSKNTEFYNKIINELYNYQAFEPAIEIYNRLIKNIKV